MNAAVTLPAKRMRAALGGVLGRGLGPKAPPSPRQVMQWPGALHSPWRAQLTAACRRLRSAVPVLMLMNLSVKAIFPAWSLKWCAFSTKPIRLTLKRSSSGGMAWRFSAVSPCHSRQRCGSCGASSTTGCASTAPSPLQASPPSTRTRLTLWMHLTSRNAPSTLKCHIRCGTRKGSPIKLQHLARLASNSGAQFCVIQQCWSLLCLLQSLAADAHTA